MERPTWAPGDIDLERPSAARMYDFYLGGSHNFAVDRQAAQEALRLVPELPLIVQANRAYLRRSVRYLLDQGVRQFIDVGSGIPTVGNVHEVVHAFDPTRRVLYVDVDPIAVTHSRAILADNENAAIIRADFLEPAQILEHPDLPALIDLDQPVGVLVNAVLHFVADELAPDAILGQFREGLAPGSYLSISHASRIGHPENADEAKQIYQRTRTPVTLRSQAEVTELFKGWTLVEPGVQLLPQWRPEPDDRTDDEYAHQVSMYGGVGLKT